LPDAVRRLALDDVHVSQAQAWHRLLVAEGPGAVEAAEEIGFDNRCELEMAFDLGAIESQGDSSVAQISIEKPFVGVELGWRWKLRRLAVAEDEVLVLGEERGDDEALDSQGLVAAGLDILRQARSGLHQ
jgi:hypothetical protein